MNATIPRIPFQAPLALERTLSGDRPTGPLHLGHYVGSLKTRLQLQNTTELYVLVADLQALTDNAGDPQKVVSNVLEVMLDYLAVGLDPERATIFIQSQVPELSELTVLLLNHVSVARLARNPTTKAEISARGFDGEVPAGFMAYPVSQAADILAFGASRIPVGDDQLPVLEITNSLARRFNRSVGRPILKECTPILSDVPRLTGLDGRSKMSKSEGNAIFLGAAPDEISAGVRRAYTDPAHVRLSDPGRVQGNVVFEMLDCFDDDAKGLAELKAHYARGGLGDAALKRRLEDRLQVVLAPIRARRAIFAQDPGMVMQLLRSGSERARDEAAKTMSHVRRAMGLHYG